MSPFLEKLPAELRLKVYAFILAPEANKATVNNEVSYDFRKALVLFKLNRQIYHESRKVFRDLNIFVRVQTPWPQTVDHVIHRQQVPVVAKGENAKQLNGCNLVVSIDAPANHMPGDYSEQFVIHLVDLSKFTKQWYYADLTYNINAHLRMNLELDAPHTPSYDTKQLPKALQRSLLLPFGDVKRLSKSTIKGELRPYASVAKELEKLQDEPYKSAEQCLADACKAKDLGNSALKAGQHNAALAHYKDAWQAMHIIIDGDTRHVYADIYFDRILTEEPYKGRHGQQERLSIRVQLVANTCLAFLQLGDYDRCIHWGMRTITMLREALRAQDDRELLPQEEAVANFAEAAHFGHIYDYTAAAFKAKGERVEAAKLWLVAREYLPADRTRIDDEIETCKR